MPLARTPPQKGNLARREHTFGPTQAFLDGTPLRPSDITPIPRSFGRSQADPTPTRGPSLKSSVLGAGPSLQPLDERAEREVVEEMEIEQGLLGGEPRTETQAEGREGREGDGEGEEMDVDVPSTLPPVEEPDEQPEAPIPQTPLSRIIAAELPEAFRLASTSNSPLSQSGSRPQSQPHPEPPSQPLPSASQPQSSQPLSQPLEPTTPRRRSRRITIQPDTPPTTLRPPPHAFSTPRRPAPAPDEDSDAPMTPGRLTRARTPSHPTAELLLAPGVPIDDGDESNFGRYYEALVRPLRIQTLDQGLGKLTLAQMAQCYPLIARESPDGLRAAWESMLEQVRTETLEGAYELFSQYRVARKLQRLAELVDEGYKFKERGEGRVDAWRPDLKPQVITTAANLAVYDESWRVLREEYLEITHECSERLRRVEEKRARLASLDNGVSEAVLELGKTNALFEDFPSASMLEWAEDVGG